MRLFPYIQFFRHWKTARISELIQIKVCAAAVCVDVMPSANFGFSTLSSSFSICLVPISCTVFLDICRLCLAFQLQGPGIHPRHCVIAHTEGVVTVTPSHQEAEIFVENNRIFDTTILQHGSLVRFGRHHAFRFVEPAGMSEGHVHQNLPSMTSRDTGYPLEYSDRLVEEEDPGRPHDGGYDVTGHHGAPPSLNQRLDQPSPPIPGGRGDPILPAVLEFWEERE